MMSQDINKRVDQHKAGKATKANRPDWIPQHFTNQDELRFLQNALRNHQETITDYEKHPHPYQEQSRDLLAFPIQATLTILIIGYGLMAGGFIAWYKRVQRPQDELTKLEIELKKSLLEKTKNEIK